MLLGIVFETNVAVSVNPFDMVYVCTGFREIWFPLLHE